MPEEHDMAATGKISCGNALAGDQDWGSISVLDCMRHHDMKSDKYGKSADRKAQKIFLDFPLSFGYHRAGSESCSS
jgi:hypothetical protein